MANFLAPFALKKGFRRFFQELIAPSYAGEATLSGFPVVGGAYSYTLPPPTGTATVTTTRQWFLDGVAIPGATSSSFSPTQAQQGGRLSVTETASNGILPNATSSSVGWLVYQYGASPDAGEVDDGLTYTGTVYYVDSTGGSDANSGLSPGAAWSSLTNVYSKVSGGSGLPVDSAFLFKRGGTYTGNIYLTLNHARVTFGAYGVGPRPKIQYATGMPFDGGSVIGSAGSSAFNRSGVRVRNLEISSEGVSLIGGIGFTWVSDVEYRNNTIHDCDRNGILVDCATSAGARRDTAVVTNNIIYNCCTNQNQGAGIGGGNCVGYTVTFNTIHDCGTINGTQSHNVYIYEYDNLTFVGNYSYCTGTRGNHGFVTHGLCNGALIARNKIENTNNGFGFSSGYPTAEGLSNFIVHSNIVRNCGQNPGAGQGYGWIINILNSSQVFNNTTYGSKINDMLLGISSPEDFPINDLSISHNTFYRGSSLTSGANLEVNGAIGTLDIQNNIFVNYSTGGSQFGLVVGTTVPDASISSRGNLYYLPSRGSTRSISYKGAFHSPSSLLALNGKEAGSSYGDPLLVDVLSGNFSLASLSPAKNAGTASTVSTDFLAVPRNLSSPSIGALE